MNDIQIIFENDDVLVIDKPTGMFVHEDGSNDGPTVVDWFLARVPAARGVGEPGWMRGARPFEGFSERSAGKYPKGVQHRYDEPGKSPQGMQLERSGVVHRLDAETSGVLALAKTQEAFVHLKAQFHDRLVKKEYRAFVYGKMEEKWGTVDRAIGRSAKDFRLRSAERGAKGTLRESTTDFERIQTGIYKDEPFTELKLFPKTGRTHQLRVHLKAIGRPIVCDALYAGKKVEQSGNLGLSRLALHAHELTLTLSDGNVHTFTAPIPAEFVEAAERIAAIG